MALDITHYRRIFDSNVATLAKGYDRSLLKDRATYKKGSGETFYIDHMGLLANVDTRIADGSSPESFKALSNIRTARKHAEDIATTPGNDTHANLVAMRTPFNEVRRQRTLSVAKIAEWGHGFNEIDDFSEVLDLKGQKINVGMRTIFRSEDQMFIDALFAASVSRISAGTSLTPATVNFPTAQQIELEYEEFGNLMTKDVLARIREKYSSNDALDEDICLVMSPLRARQLIEQSGDSIHSTDFISKSGYFERGEFPDVYGVKLIEHSLAPDNKVGAFQMSGMAWVDFNGGIKSDMDKDINERSQLKAYIREYADCVRMDDARIVWAHFETTSAS